MDEKFLDFVSIQLDRTLKEALYVQLYNGLRQCIEAGHLSQGYLLPPVRRFAKYLGINAGTVVNAYKLLEQNGYIFSREGSGSYVAALKDPVNDDADDKDHGNAFELIDLLSPDLEERYINLSSVALDPALISVEAFKGVLNEVLERDKGYAFGYQESQGFYPLRESVAAYLSQGGVLAEASDVQIISGAQQGIDIVAKAFLDYGDYVVVENPTYPGAIAAFRSRGAKIVEVPMEEDGISMDVLEEQLRRFRPKLLYVMPNIQNPTGYSYTPAKRSRLMGLARYYNTIVLEDDYISDLAYQRERMAPLKALDRDDRVIYLKSFSKIFMPGLRLAFLTTPKRLAEQLLVVKHTTDISTSGLTQRSFDLYLRKGIWQKHIEEIRRLYFERFQCMTEAISRFIPPAVRCVRPQGGLAFWLTLPEGISARRVVEETRRREVLIVDGRPFFSRFSPDRSIRMSFAAATPAEIRRGVQVVGEVIAHCGVSGKKV